ncbi:MAG: DegT/DnrJ/EryC1/StrS family aminotransferase [Acidimicrobiales bacterium]
MANEVSLQEEFVVETAPPARVEFHRHSIGAEEKEAVGRILDSLFLTTGQEAYTFESEFASFLGVPYVVGVSSCTAAEHLALLAFDIGPGDEVITTPMTFVATATAIVHAGATPVFVDVEPTTGNIDANLIEAAITARTRAIVAVHLYGTMCDMRALRAIADRHGLILIEDAAHCVEGTRDSVGVGHLGDATCFSFYATKALTSGEGGAIAVKDERIAERLRTIRLHGMSKNAADRYHGAYQHWDMVELGFKCNLTNIQAAMLRPQLSRLHAQRDRREQVAQAYDRVVDATPGLSRPSVPEGARSARHLYTVWSTDGRRDDIIRSLGEQGVGCAVNYRAIHKLTWLAQNVEQRFPLPEAERIGDQTVSLPIYDKLTDAEVERVGAALQAAAHGD